jgi:hypothetical protein
VTFKPTSKAPTEKIKNALTVHLILLPLDLSDAMCTLGNFLLWSVCFRMRPPKVKNDWMAVLSLSQLRLLCVVGFETTFG